MTDMMDGDQVQAFLEHLRGLPYVKGVRLKDSSKVSHDALLEIRTPKGSSVFILEMKRAFLERSATNALLALATSEKTPLLLFARYIPRPTGERLAAAGINFVDEAGNIHLQLGKNYHTLLLGKQPDRRAPETKRLSAAAVQVFFTFLVSPEAIQWPARRVAEAAGVSKTAASDARQRLVAEGVVRRQGARGYQLIGAHQLEERFIQGYGRVLRPHLRLAQMSAKDRDPDAFVERFSEVAKQNKLPWALTGGAGAYSLDRFYRGGETALFLPTLSKQLQQELLMLPDHQGPITFLRLFSPLVLWPGKTSRPVAHPWLVYAELLLQDDPRALEAAREIKNRYLDHESSIA